LGRDDADKSATEMKGGYSSPSTPCESRIYGRVISRKSIASPAGDELLSLTGVVFEERRSRPRP